MIFDLIEDLLGQAPNELIEGLYYVLGIILIVLFMKVLLITFRSLFNITNHSGRF